MKRALVLQTFVCVGLLCVIWGGYFLVKEYYLDRLIEIKDDDFSWVYQIDEGGIDRSKFVISGFAFQSGTTTSENYEIILRDIDRGKLLFTKTKYKERQDVKEYFKLTDSCLKLGFIATTRSKELINSDGCYEILLRIKGEKTAYKTGIYVSQGILMTSPDKKTELKVDDTELKEIVKNGVLLVQESEKGIWIYQVKESLYWIASNDYIFDENNDVFMRYQMFVMKDETAREWIGKGFWFAQNEIADMNTGEYRVAKVEIPGEYPVETIKVGERASEWKWIKYFRPRYEWSGK